MQLGVFMKKVLPETKETEIPEAEAQDSQVNDDFLSEWSNIDATSIYRKGTESEKPADKTELNQIVKETNNFFKIGIGMFIFVFIIILITKYI